MNLIINALAIIIFGGLGLLIFALGVYVRYKRTHFINDGVKTIFKVKDVIVEETYDEETEETTQKYQTIFEFYYDGKLIEETLETHHEYNIGQEITGAYLPNARIDKIKMPNEGFYATDWAEYVLMGIGLSLMIYILVGVLSS